MPQFRPNVDPAAEFLEISNDFTDPKEIIREAISNAFDSGADIIRVTASIDKTSGDDELVITLEDNGHGMDEEGLKAFFGLGISTRRAKDQYGRKATSAIGEKGHGTTIYFKSRRIEVASINNGKAIDAYMDHPRKTLRRGELPANRGDLDNTPPATMQAIRETVENIFKSRIVPSEKFQKYQEDSNDSSTTSMLPKKRKTLTGERKRRLEKGH